ncbi:TPA: transglutaminase domain-containing protein [Candidatus Woesearchaeota archaeon]|nr:transglutaminase domain-containing protein [Candidatus Woesearchaeota archaeon]HIH13489.1 transglutaminase domain-containing protein [Candidatus Woesearchaeota archaeon]
MVDRMKKGLGIMLVLLMLLPVVLAMSKENLYLRDSLQLKVEVKGELELIATGEDPKLKEATAELFLYPKEDFRQRILQMNNKGEARPASSFYRWTDQTLGTKQFGYTASLRTENEKLRVKSKIPYPLTDISGLQQYTLPSETIDSNSPTVVSKAAELAQGEDDLFILSFKIASWVEENVDYDLNTLTSSASQKASWVLEHKQGVCDEMASLFVAMMRSLGIPARFVSGISYTTSDLFTENWQPHGWAEVYFPEVGWVPFDIAFGQYAYVDVTHIKLRDGFDPAEPATKYEWLAQNVDLKARTLDFGVEIEKKGPLEAEELLLEEELLNKEVGFGSYNLIKGIVKNTADYYTAAALELAVPKEIMIIGRNRRNLVLEPKEVKETFWVVKVNSDLDPHFIYTFPSMIYSEKNVSVSDSFSVQKNQPVYSEPEIRAVTVQDEEKSYSRKVSLECEYPHEVSQGEEVRMACTIQNNGDTDLKEIDFCLEQVCEKINLGVRQEESSSITIDKPEVGWNKVMASAENELIEKRNSFSYVVLDNPQVEVTVTHPPFVDHGQNIHLAITLQKVSFTTPEKVQVLVEGAGFQNKWQVDALPEKQQYDLNIENVPVSSRNTFTITTTWNDKQGKTFTDTKTIDIPGKAEGFMGTITLWLNGILKWFYG